MSKSVPSSCGSSRHTNTSKPPRVPSHSVFIKNETNYNLTDAAHEKVLLSDELSLSSRKKDSNGSSIYSSSCGSSRHTASTAAKKRPLSHSGLDKGGNKSGSVDSKRDPYQFLDDTDLEQLQNNQPPSNQNSDRLAEDQERPKKSRASEPSNKKKQKQRSTHSISSNGEKHFLSSDSDEERSNPDLGDGKVYSHFPDYIEERKKEFLANQLKRRSGKIWLSSNFHETFDYGFAIKALERDVFDEDIGFERYTPCPETLRKIAKLYIKGFWEEVRVARPSIRLPKFQGDAIAYRDQFAKVNLETLQVAELRTLVNVHYIKKEDSEPTESGEFTYLPKLEDVTWFWANKQSNRPTGWSLALLPFLVEYSMQLVRLKKNIQEMNSFKESLAGEILRRSDFLIGGTLKTKVNQSYALLNRYVGGKPLH